MLKLFLIKMKIGEVIMNGFEIFRFFNGVNCFLVWLVLGFLINMYYYLL